MRAIQKVCKYCNDIYTYYLSGNISNPQYNDDTYCPSCKAKIISALENVEHVNKYDWAVINFINDEEFEVEKNKQLLNVYTIEYRDTEIVGITYKTYNIRKITKKDTGESLICAKVIVDIKTNKVLYFNDCIPIVNKEKTQKGYEQYREFVSDRKSALTWEI
jgi:copper chaperone CopZ